MARITLMIPMVIEYSPRVSAEDLYREAKQLGVAGYFDSGSEATFKIIIHPTVKLREIREAIRVDKLTRSSR